jgi:hypothetical protein
MEVGHLNIYVGHPHYIWVPPERHITREYGCVLFRLKEEQLPLENNVAAVPVVEKTIQPGQMLDPP